MSVDLQSPSFLVHTPLMSRFLPSTTTVLVTSKKSFRAWVIAAAAAAAIDQCTMRHAVYK
jgi:hypothetical protein